MGNPDTHPQSEEFAKEYVDRLPPELASTIGGLALIIGTLHTGTNAYGEHITPDEREVLIRTKESLKKKLKDIYTGDKKGLDGIFGEYKAYLHGIRAEFIKRATIK